MALFVLAVFLFLETTSGQQLSGNSISEFVGQLTNLINQNGGIGSLGSVLQQGQGQVLQQGPDGGFGLFTRPGKPHSYPPGPPYRPQGPPPLAPYPGVQQPYPVAPPYAPQYPSRPGAPSQGFFSALASIARYDDLRCVPRLLCEVTAGGKPGYAGSQQSVVPLTSKDSLIALLTVLNFVDDSPLLVFGRAALLGYTSRGNSRTCLTAYPTCPRDPDALVDYLNNHNGGFFRYFSGAPSHSPYLPPYDQPSYPQYPQGTHSQYPQSPYPQYAQGPQYPNYLENKYPHYPSRPYQPIPHRYPTRPYSSLNGQSPYRYAGKYTAAKDYYQERIQIRPQTIITNYNDYYRDEDETREQSKLVFPTRGGKELHFPNESTQSYSVSATPVPFFPDRTGTGKLLLDNQGVHYATPQNLINFRDQRSIKFPVIMNFPKT